MGRKDPNRKDEKWNKAQPDKEGIESEQSLQSAQGRGRHARDGIRGVPTERRESLDDVQSELDEQ
ncbi:hypothetical protein [Streptomyces sp. NPDC007205]|uniref:hypothetical protein n=1 Tax=Streptomyces sp. NPDC007205 TaxID=3154316 RepID=UPI00340B84EE